MLDTSGNMENLLDATRARVDLTDELDAVYAELNEVPPVHRGGFETDVERFPDLRDFLENLRPRPLDRPTQDLPID